VFLAKRQMLSEAAADLEKACLQCRGDSERKALASVSQQVIPEVTALHTTDGHAGRE
jgi:hypothetical protein